MGDEERNANEARLSGMWVFSVSGLLELADHVTKMIFKKQYSDYILMENYLDKLMKTTSEILPPILAKRSSCFLPLVNLPENSKALLLNPAFTTWEVRRGLWVTVFGKPGSEEEAPMCPEPGFTLMLGGLKGIGFEQRNASCALLRVCLHIKNLEPRFPGLSLFTLVQFPQQNENVLRIFQQPH